MNELNFIIDMTEEQLVKGNLRWLANFNEIQRDYAINNTVFPIYASGGLQERGFFLSKIYSALVTPKYKVHFLLYTSPEIDSKLLRNIILSFKNRFGPDEWVFLASVQTQPIGKNVKETITGMQEKTIGITAFSLGSKETVCSDNVLGKGLAKNLKLSEVKFEAFDFVNYLKGFLIIFFLSAMLLVTLALLGLKEAVQPLTLLLAGAFSIIVGYSVYKSRYHTTLTLSTKGFMLKEGGKVREARWSEYSDVTIHIAPNREAFLRLHAKENKLDLPLSRAGVTRSEAFSFVKELIGKR